jgi:signal peptidase II
VQAGTLASFADGRWAREPQEEGRCVAGPRSYGAIAAIAVGIGVLTLDQVSKALVVAQLSGHQPVVLFAGLVSLSLVRNPGAAFSIGTSFTAVFALVEAGVVVVILRVSRRLRSWLWTIALGLLLGGAAGNLADRLFRSPGPLRGYAVDWIKLDFFAPWFNLADSAIVLGAVLLVLASVSGLRIDGTRAPHSAQAVRRAARNEETTPTPPGGSAS